MAPLGYNARMGVDPTSGGDPRPLRRGWTTGACATAATHAAYVGLVSGKFPDPVTITLPGGETPSFPLAAKRNGRDRASAAVLKDAGDDPDVTHGVRIEVTIAARRAGAGITFVAGDGVGTVTRPGLPVPPGEPAINPGPRRMMEREIGRLASSLGGPPDVEVTVAIPGGAALAARTMNGRLGIVGGLSVLGTSGIVKPYSCAAWVASIHQGIDVAVAEGLPHLAGATGRGSEAAVQRLYKLPERALIDMGDFAGAMLKYLRTRPVARVTIAGGFGKIAKLAQGRMDLRANQGTIDLDRLCATYAAVGGGAADLAEARQARTANEVLAIASRTRLALADAIAQDAQARAYAVMGGAEATADLDVVIFDRDGTVIGRAGP